MSKVIDVSKVIKEYKTTAMLIIFGLMIAMIGCGLYGVSINPYKRLIGVKLPEASTILTEDRETGFLGDGEYYLEVQLTNAGAEKFLNHANKTGDWLPVPLPKEYEKVLFQIGTKSKNIPEDIQNGIFYTRDRLAQREPHRKNENISSRGVFNDTVSILDFETKKLYIYKLDT